MEKETLQKIDCKALMGKSGKVYGFYYSTSGNLFRAFRRKDGETMLFQYLHQLKEWIVS